VRLLTWNILHGGGPTRLPEIILALLGHKPDVILLTEFRATRGSQIRAVLADHGLEHQLTSRSIERVNGLLLASRTPLRGVSVEGAPGMGRWLGAEAPEYGLLLGGVHVPDDTLGPQKTAFWKFLLQAGALWKTSRAVFFGDFNTSRRGLDGGPRGQRCEPMLRAFVEGGYTDAWRLKHPEAAEFSWFSHEGKGWRIDSAYVSAGLVPVLQTAFYSQVERESGHSDHAPLVVELGLETEGAPGGLTGGGAGVEVVARGGLFGRAAGAAG
jgi:exodeoxyribonuclease-3